MYEEGGIEYDRKEASDETDIQNKMGYRDYDCNNLADGFWSSFRRRNCPH